MALWNFNMGVNRKNVKCAIFWKRLTIGQNRWKFVTHSHMYCICRVLFVSDSFSSVWGHSVYFAKFPMLCSKGYCSHSFHPIWYKIYGKYCNQGEIQVIIFIVICQILKTYGTLMISASQLSYIGIRRAMLLSSGRRSSRSMPLVLLL